MIHATEPGQSVAHRGNPKIIPGTAASTDVKFGLLLMPSTGSYTNGFDVMSANYGDSNTGEGRAYQAEIRAWHSQAETLPFDKNVTACAVGQQIDVVEHIIGELYWLPASTITCSKDDKLFCNGSGTVAKQTAHTATPLPHHTWICAKAASSKDWVLGEYIGITSMFTA